jgi:hypothetical protein
MANTTTAVLESLKYSYGANRVLYLFNEESVVFNILDKVKKPMGGRGQFIMPIITQNPGAFAGITEGGTLPTPLDMDTAEAVFSLQEYVATYNVSWKLIQDSRNDKFAFQQAVTMLDEGLKRRIFRNLNSDLIGTGKGELFTITGADASTVVTSYYLPRVEKGMVVDVMDLTDDDAKVGDSLTVEAVDPIARTVDLSGALTGEAAGDYGVIQDTCDVTSNNPAYHSNGLLGVINASNPAAVVGNYGGINRSTAGNEYWKSLQLANGGTNRAFTEDLGLQALDGVREKGGGKLSHWISNLAIARRYHEILAAERFFAMSSPGTLSGGIGRKQNDMGKDGKSVYEFSGVPWHIDPFFTNNTIVGIDDSHFFLGVGENDVPRPISEIFDNVPFFKQTTAATFEVNWYYQMELLSDNPAAGVRIDDVAEA